MRSCRPLLGTFVEVEADSGAAIEAAFAAIEQVHRLMSVHEPDSDLSRINRFAHLAPVDVHEWTAAVLDRALFWWRRSRGAFDVVRAGKAALESGALPRHSDQPHADAADSGALLLDGHAVRLLQPGCVDLGGIAKGFAVDCAADALRSAGCKRGLINAGGDIFAFGAEPWDVEILDPATRCPRVRLALQDKAVATSAGLPEADGELSFAHLLRPEGRWASATVVAPAAIDADALTKIVWAAPHQAKPLLDEAGARALVIGRSGEVETPFEQLAA